MHHMGSPEKIDLVAHPVRPVIGKIYQYEKKYQRESIWGYMENSQFFVDQLIYSKAENNKKYAGQLLGNSATYICYCITKPVKFLLGKLLYQ